ncbi:hypothetical protein AB0O28_01970 [Microbispora sp. NPDC088329]
MGFVLNLQDIPGNASGNREGTDPTTVLTTFPTVTSYLSIIGCY